MQVPVSGKADPLSMTQAGEWWLGSRVAKSSPGGPGGKWDEYEKAVTWQKKASQAILTEVEAVHLEKELSFYSAFSRVLCPSLGLPIRNSYWEIEPFHTRLWRCWRAGAFVLWKEAKEAGLVHIEKEMALARPKSRPQLLTTGHQGHGVRPTGAWQEDRRSWAYIEARAVQSRCKFFFQDDGPTLVGPSSALQMLKTQLDKNLKHPCLTSRWPCFNSLRTRNLLWSHPTWLILWS